MIKLHQLRDLVNFAEYLKEKEKMYFNALKEDGWSDERRKQFVEILKVVKSIRKRYKKRRLKK
jgi:hypothetical protein